MRCKACNAYIPEGATHCLECGAGFEDELVCQRCGATAPISARYCRKCGEPLLPPPIVASEGAPERGASKGDSKCPRCGSQVPQETVHCPTCGLNQRTPYVEPKTSEPEQPSDETESTSPTREAAPCPVCGTIPRGSGRFCYECGRFLGTDIEDVICPVCGADHSLRYSRCQYCGADLPSPRTRT